MSTRTGLLLAALLPLLSTDAMAETPPPDQLALAVRRAVEAANADLDRMPFFVRPLARRGFTKRTGLAHDEWIGKLSPFRADDTPAKVRARWPGVDESLERLAENFRTAPARAREKMDDPAVLKEIEESAKQRLAAVEALAAWLRGSPP